MYMWRNTLFYLQWMEAHGIFVYPSGRDIVKSSTQYCTQKSNLGPCLGPNCIVGVLVYAFPAQLHKGIDNVSTFPFANATLVGLVGKYVSLSSLSSLSISVVCVLTKPLFRPLGLYIDTYIIRKHLAKPQSCKGSDIAELKSVVQ